MLYWPEVGTPRMSTQGPPYLEGKAGAQGTWPAVQQQPLAKAWGWCVEWAPSVQHKLLAPVSFFLCEPWSHFRSLYTLTVCLPPTLAMSYIFDLGVIGNTISFFPSAKCMHIHRAPGQLCRGGVDINCSVSPMSLTSLRTGSKCLAPTVWPWCMGFPVGAVVAKINLMSLNPFLL